MSPPPPLIDQLPEELLLSVFENLDCEPPSISKSRLEPTLDLTSSETHHLKDISTVSTRWRRIALPLLFKFSRIHLNKPIKKTQSSSHFLRFVEANGLKIYSIAMIVDGRICSQSSSQDNNNSAEIAAFWHNLLHETSATRVVIVAPPADLASLTDCKVDLSAEWAFEDMDYHILELRYDNVQDDVQAGFLDSTSIPVDSRTDLALRSDSYSYKTGLFMLRPWTHLGLNEGSFIKAYGTYHYFEHGPPSLILSIKDCCLSTWSSIRSFSYTAILPFSSQIDFRAILPRLEELDIKLAPDPRSGILDDKTRVGRAQMSDCWQEFRSSYRLREFPKSLPLHQGMY